MPDVLRPFRRVDQRVKSLSRLKYTVVITTVLVAVIVLMGIFLGDIGEVLNTTSAGIIFVYAAGTYALYPWTVGDREWSLPTSWPDEEE